MENILGFLRRKGASETAEARPRAKPLPSPQPAPPTRTAASSNDEGAANELVAELTPARRQASQLNMNRYFASAPVGLNAVLKNPSRQDLEASRSGGSITLQTAGAAAGHRGPSPGQQQGAQQQQPQQQHGNPDAPLSRPMRERRRSMTVSEIAQGMNNIDVSQAAMIMMPGRMRQEMSQQSFTQMQQNQAALLQLQQLQQAFGGGGGGPPASLISPGHLPQLGRSNGQVPSLFTADPSVHAGTAATAAATVSPAAPGAPPRLERKPSIIREAVKMQAAQQGSPVAGATGSGGAGMPPAQLGSPGTTRGEAHLRTHAGNFSGELQSAPLSQIASALAGQGPERNTVPARPGGGERRPSVLVTSSQLGGVASVGSSGRGALSSVGSNGSAAFSPSAPIPVPQPPSTPRGSRGSDPGEPFRTRAVTAAQIELPIGGGGAGLYGGASSGKDLRRGVMANRSGDQYGPEDTSVHPMIPGGSEVKLPSIPTGVARRANGDTRDRDGGPAAGGGGGGAVRNALSAADVAAITEAMNSYQSEAARLRAVALRKVDTRIKRAVMERHGVGEDDTTSPGGPDNGNTPLTALLRSPMAATARTSMVPPSPSGGRARLPDAHRSPTGAAVAAGGSGDTVWGRSRVR